MRVSLTGEKTKAYEMAEVTLLMSIELRLRWRTECLAAVWCQEVSSSSAGDPGWKINPSLTSINPVVLQGTVLYVSGDLLNRLNSVQSAWVISTVSLALTNMQSVRAERRTYPAGFPYHRLIQTIMSPEISGTRLGFPYVR